MKLTLARVALACASLALGAHAQQLLWTFTGSVGDEYGAALHPTADQNSDGYPDLLVGAPGWNNARGYIRALSGRFLATGTGPTTLWTYFNSTGPAGARAGSSIIEVASLTGDSATDYVISVPDQTSNGSFFGGLFLIDGSTHALAATIFGELNTHLGASIAAVGDQDGDGKVDIAASAPTANGGPSWVHVISGKSFGVTQSLANSVHWSLNANSSSSYGAVVASGFDLDHDGRFDLAIGSPDLFVGGLVQVVRADGTWAPLGAYAGTGPERAGAALDGTQDFDGDGRNDLVVGAPNWSANGGPSQDGRVVVLSGAKLLANMSPQMLELRYANFPTGFHFGSSVRASGDLNGDGVPDVIVGMPDYSIGQFPPLINRGMALIFSGASGGRMAAIQGANFDHFGDASLGAGLDLNSDGFPDFAVAGSLSSISTPNCGALKFYSLFPCSWSNYCTAKVNSLGCTPGISATGQASATSPAPFVVTCNQVLNQRTGLLMYSHAPNAASFQGGTLCVKPPLKRTSPQNSGGSTSGSDCSGTFAFDMNARIQSGLDPTLVPGAETYCQYWSRDSGSSSTTSLSNALRFVINP